MGTDEGSDRSPDEAVPNSEKARSRPSADRSRILHSVAVATAVLLAANLIAGIFDSTFWRTATLVLTAIVVFGNDGIGRHFIRTAIVLAVTAVAVVLVRDAGELAAGRSSLADVPQEVVSLVASFGPGKQLVGISSHGDQAPSQAPGAAPEEEEPESTIDDFEDHLKAFTPRDVAVNNRASLVAHSCEQDDRLCQATLIARFASNNVEYRSDPVRQGVGDYIKPPTQTLDAMAGDCEDKALLLVSMLQSLRIRAILVSHPGHILALVCFDKPVLELVMKRYDDGGWNAISYLRTELPSQPTLFDSWLYELCEVMITTDGERDYCYPVESTAEDSWLTHQPDWNLQTTLVDPAVKRIIPTAEIEFSPSCNHRPGR